MLEIVEKINFQSSGIFYKNTILATIDLQPHFNKSFFLHFFQKKEAYFQCDVSLFFLKKIFYSNSIFYLEIQIDIKYSIILIRIRNHLLPPLQVFLL